MTTSFFARVLRRATPLYAALSVTLALSNAAAQPDAEPFDLVLNIGAGPIPGVVMTGDSVGDGNVSLADAGFVTTANLAGDVLPPRAQLNVYPGGLIRQTFAAAPIDGSDSGTELNIYGGSTDRRLEVFGGSVVNILGGEVGEDCYVRDGGVLNLREGSLGRTSYVFVGGEVNISGGTVGEFFNPLGGSITRISGGTIGDEFNADIGSVVDISGGSIGEEMSVQRAAEVHLSGGSIGPGLEVRVRGIMIISGGSIPDNFVALTGSEVRLYGLEFALDGRPLADLPVGHPMIIETRQGTLAATLADGSPLDVDLDPTAGGDVISPTATLRITRVPCRASVLAAPLDRFDAADVREALRRIEAELPTGDSNGDGSIDLFDLIAALAQADAECEAN